MDNQDWTPVRINKSNTKHAGTATRTPVQTANTIGNSHIRKLDTDEIVKPKQLSHEGRTELIQKRAALKFNQVQLNQLCRFPVNTIREIEAGRQQPTHPQLNMLNRLLKSAVKFEN